MLRRLVIARHHPSAVLLAVQLLGVLLYAVLEDLPGGRAVLAAFGLVVLGAALQVVRSSPWFTWFATTLAFVIVALLGINAVWPSTHLDIAASVLLAAFYFYAAGALIAYMLQDQVASLDEFYAVGATFTLIAWAFAHLYFVCQALAPGSFAGVVNPEQARGWMDLLFLSFTILSGVGLGDIVPLAPMARALVMLEEFTGVMYLALVVSRLITMAAAGRKSSPSSDDAP
ncbi:MAG: ion channel [Panacagrimonas sp.]